MARTGTKEATKANPGAGTHLCLFVEDDVAALDVAVHNVLGVQVHNTTVEERERERERERARARERESVCLCVCVCVCVCVSE